MAMMDNQRYKNAPQIFKFKKKIPSRTSHHVHYQTFLKFCIVLFCFFFLAGNCVMHMEMNLADLRKPETGLQDFKAKKQ